MRRQRFSTVGLAAPGRLPAAIKLEPGGASTKLSLPSLAWPWRPEREQVPEFDRPTVPPPVGNRGNEPAAIVLVIDDSGSTASTDPNGFRYTAARRLVNLLVDGVGGPPLGDRIGVVQFADQPQPWLPLTSVRNKRDRRKVRQALQPLAGGGTSIAPAITRAAHLLAGASDRRQICLLFTDGESIESGYDLRRATERLPFGSLHVVVLGGELPEQWKDVPVGSVNTLTSLSRPDDFEWLLGRALYRSLGLGPWAGPLEPPGPATSALSNHPTFS